jgi:hypothetical protein
MSIYYRMMEQTDNLHPEENRKRGFYPRIISKRTVKVRELCRKDNHQRLRIGSIRRTNCKPDSSRAGRR